MASLAMNGPWLYGRRREGEDRINDPDFDIDSNNLLPSGRLSWSFILNNPIAKRLTYFFNKRYN